MTKDIFASNDLNKIIPKLYTDLKSDSPYSTEEWLSQNLNWFLNRVFNDDRPKLSSKASTQLFSLLKPNGGALHALILRLTTLNYEYAVPVDVEFPFDKRAISLAITTSVKDGCVNVSPYTLYIIMLSQYIQYYEFLEQHTKNDFCQFSVDVLSKEITEPRHNGLLFDQFNKQFIAEINFLLSTVTNSTYDGDNNFGGDESASTLETINKSTDVINATHSTNNSTNKNLLILALSFIYYVQTKPVFSPPSNVRLYFANIFTPILLFKNIKFSVHSDLVRLSYTFLKTCITNWPMNKIKTFEGVLEILIQIIQQPPTFTDNVFTKFITAHIGFYTFLVTEFLLFTFLWNLQKPIEFYYLQKFLLNLTPDLQSKVHGVIYKYLKSEEHSDIKLVINDHIINCCGTLGRKIDKFYNLNKDLGIRLIRRIQCLRETTEYGRISLLDQNLMCNNISNYLLISEDSYDEFIEKRDEMDRSYEEINNEIRNKNGKRKEKINMKENNGLKNLKDSNEWFGGKKFKRIKNKLYCLKIGTGMVVGFAILKKLLDALK
eukprot:GAHX01001398.1.p1 GENE.GAHX01001398.1~~GAHX01001398.1.p1  ORF type:complete len:547 (-),score=107.00 GAHX01001398.1:125-1765(-)